MLVQAEDAAQLGVKAAGERVEWRDLLWHVLAALSVLMFQMWEWLLQTQEQICNASSPVVCKAPRSHRICVSVQQSKHKLCAVMMDS